LRSSRALDWFVFFLADVQTGFGPFIAVYLTTQKWTQAEIGLVLSVNGFVALLGQIPGGALVDWARSERLVAALSVAVIGISALAYAAWPIFPVVLAAAILQAAASCVLGPTIAAISLGLVGRGEIGRRLGRNARFASIGSGLAAAAMGACGYFLSSRSVFIVTLLLTIPTIVSCALIRAQEINPELAHGADESGNNKSKTTFWTLARNSALMKFALVLFMFQFANAAMLPTLGGLITMQSSTSAPAVIAACMVVPQIVVALLSPSIGLGAQTWGRRPFLLVGMGALLLRTLLFAFIRDPNLLVLIQIFDGISASIFSVLVPLIVVDVTYGSGRFNVAQGIVGTATGIGASVSVLLAGYVADHAGGSAAFLALGIIAAAAFNLVWFVMPETRPRQTAAQRGLTRHSSY
jgi:MFS family permease